MNTAAFGAETRARLQTLRDSGLFDPAWYATRHPEAAALGLDPALHYLWIGGHLGHAPSSAFDGARYLRDNPDAAAAGANPLLHYLERGRAEGRAIHPPEAAAPADSAGAEPTGRGAPQAPRWSASARFGTTFLALVEAARARLKPRGGAEDYDRICDDFDIAYYFACHHDIARAPAVDPVRHYIDDGAREGRNPAPGFSTRHYCARYPEVGESGLNPFYHWLTIGRAHGYIAEGFADFEAMCAIIGRPPTEVQRRLTERRADLRARLEEGELGEMVARAAAFEPLIAQAWTEALQIKLPPFHSDDMASRVVAMHRLLEAAGFRRARIVIAVNRPRWGGGRRMEGHIAHALTGRCAPDEIVIVNTDGDGTLPPGRFPAGCRHVDMAGVVAGLTPDVRQRLLVEFLRALRPAAVFNVNSRLLWDALTPYGKALAATTPIHACLFCNEQTPFGHWTGYPARFFYRHFDVLAGVCCDSHALAEALCRQFQLPPAWQERIAVLEAPVDAAQPPAPPPPATPGRRAQIFWAGRFDRQKRVDLVHEVARRLPEVDFRLWGEAVLQAGPPLPPAPDNVATEGPYASFADLPLGDCDLWLYTAQWDGVPSLLLEVAMAAVPLVGSIAGGTGEILREGLSQPVHDIEDIDAYVAGIRAVLQNPAAARDRALRLREVLAERRTQAAYLQTLERLLPAGAIAPPQQDAPDAPGKPEPRESEPPQSGPPESGLAGSGPRGPGPDATGPASPAPIPGTIVPGSPDLTVIVTAHDETVVSGPSMLAADAAVRHARAAGFTVETLVVLDSATPRCRAFFMQPALDHWQRIEMAERDLGRVRNAIVPRSRGRHIAFLDADDLFSENWLTEGIRSLDAAAAEGRRAIAHPELNWLFDGGKSVFVKPAQDDPLFTPIYFYLSNYYDSLCMAPRAAHLEIPYVHRDIPNGLSYQDWQFSIETMAAGWHHLVARDTVIFKRRRDASLVTESSARRSIVRQLEPMAIDRVRGLGRDGAGAGTEPGDAAQEQPAGARDPE